MVPDTHNDVAFATPTSARRWYAPQPAMTIESQAEVVWEQSNLFATQCFVARALLAARRAREGNISRRRRAYRSAGGIWRPSPSLTRRATSEHPGRASIDRSPDHYVKSERVAQSHRRTR